MVRFKHRYLLVSLVFPSTLPNPLAITPVVPVEKSPFINESGLISLLRDSLSVNFGDVGAGEVGGTFTIKYMSPQTNLVIIRVARYHYRTLWAALTLLRRLGGLEVIARVLHVSGTIRKIQHAAIALDRSILLESAAKVAQIMDPEQAVTTENAAGEKEETTLQAQLRKSEGTIMAMEA